MVPSPEPTGTLVEALAHAGGLLTRDPALAAEQAREILAVMPGVARAHTMLGHALARLGDGAGALGAFERAVVVDRTDPEAWRALGDQRGAAGDTAGADAAYAAGLKVSSHNPRLVEAAGALAAGKLAVAEPILRAFLMAYPTDVAAIRMLAELAGRLGRYADAEALLTRAVELSPSFDAARHNLALMLYRQNKAADALPHLERLGAGDPANPMIRNLHAAALGQVGEYERAVAIWEELLANYPNQPKAWMSYGHALKTLGRAGDAVAAYARAVASQPGLGEAWWSLANMKTYRFGPDEIAAMEAQLGGEIDAEDRLHFEFALGKAAEDGRDHAAAFDRYARGNALGREANGYDADATTASVDRAVALFTSAFFAARAGGGDPVPDPIFVVGLPRAGSTLVEQILASHSQVEGTMELPEMVAIARRIGGRNKPGEISRYPEALGYLTPGERTALGAEYLASTRIYRKTARPFFIDKMPNNWAHVGLIHLILPNAKIVDARRHPMANGFSAWKQHFARGQGFTYDLTDLGRYWRDYARAMGGIDRALPGRVHRVIYERMVTDTKAEVRALLAYCGLPFEPACLTPHKTERAVRTPSAEQVRRPIHAQAVDEWQHYAAMLQPLSAALGDALDAYPDVPDAF